jgi:hypothetical protein
MNNSIMQELKAHVQDLISEDRINHDNADDAHHIAFNEDYYIIGYYQADEWLKKHDVTPWQAMAYIASETMLHIGECNLKEQDFNSEWAVNQIAYFAGLGIDFEELLTETEEA